MEFIHELLRLLTDTRGFILEFINDHGTLVYALLFLIIFVETGLVIMPFLPGDSLLFVAGTFCAGAAPALDLAILIPLLCVAAILGDNINYAVGRFAGTRMMKLRIGKRILIKQAWLDKTHAFFEKYGTKTIILARFVPIVRTITPFVAGVGQMDYKKKFLPYDVFGGVLWISSMSLCGYFFGNIPWVEQHFEAVVVGIIALSVLPMIIAFLRHRFGRKKA